MTEARIYSQGYRRYEGERSGLSGARLALARHSIRIALGLGMSARHKLLPAAIIIMAYLPAAAMIGLAALLPTGTEGLLPDYPDYYGFVSATIYLLAGITVPAILCPDRRDGMLGLYLASPLTRPQYLLGKAMAMIAMILTVTLGPTLLLLIAYTLQDLGPGTVGDWLLALWRIVVSAFVMGLPMVALAAAISSITDRRGIAAAIVLVIVLTSAPIPEVLVQEAGFSPVLRLLEVSYLPQALIYRIFDSTNGWALRENPTWTIWLGWFGWVVGCSAFTYYRYHRMEVTR